jgi:hypothetical protein
MDKLIIYWNEHRHIWYIVYIQAESVVHPSCAGVSTLVEEFTPYRKEEEEEEEEEELLYCYKMPVIFSELQIASFFFQLFFVFKSNLLDQLFSEGFQVHLHNIVKRMFKQW